MYLYLNVSIVTPVSVFLSISAAAVALPMLVAKYRAYINVPMHAVNIYIAIVCHRGNIVPSIHMCETNANYKYFTISSI